jgi:hypothetical protein
MMSEPSLSNQAVSRRQGAFATLAVVAGFLAIMLGWWLLFSDSSLSCISGCTVHGSTIVIGNMTKGATFEFQYVGPSYAYGETLVAITIGYFFSAGFLLISILKPGYLGRNLPEVRITTAAVIAFAVSIIIHFPNNLVGSFMGQGSYSDVLSFWFTRSGVNQGLIPYVQYYFEYPPLAGALIYLASVARNLFVYTTVMFSAAFLSMLVSLAFTYKLVVLRSGSRKRLLAFFALTPVFVYYSVYNFDWFSTASLIASLYFFVTGRERCSGLLLGLGAAAKLIPILALPFMIREGKHRTELLLWTLVGWLGPYAVFFLANPSRYISITQQAYLASVFIEDSWVALLPASKYVTIILFSLALLIIWRRKLPLTESMFVTLVAFIAVSYDAAPQFLIFLLPFCALIEVNYTLFLVANLLDAAIIQFLYSFGPDAFSPANPIQWVSYARQLVLVAMALVWLRRFSGPGVRGALPPHATLPAVRFLGKANDRTQALIRGFFPRVELHKWWSRKRDARP